jgi:protein KRI1
MRRVEDKRKQNRLDAKARKEEDKLKKKEEINKLKALKREEIVNKLKKAEYVAGKFGNDQKGSSESGAVGGILNDKKLLEKAEKELQTEFIPDLYDKTMDALFND